MYHPPRTCLPPFPPMQRRKRMAVGTQGGEGYAPQQQQQLQMYPLQYPQQYPPPGDYQQAGGYPQQYPATPPYAYPPGEDCVSACAVCHHCLPSSSPLCLLSPLLSSAASRVGAGTLHPCTVPLWLSHLNPKPSPRYPAPCCYAVLQPSSRSLPPPAPMLSCNPLPLPCCSRGDTAAPSPHGPDPSPSPLLHLSPLLQVLLPRTAPPLQGAQGHPPPAAPQ